MIYAELANPGILNVLVGATNVIEHDDASSETDAKRNMIVSFKHISGMNLIRHYNNSMLMTYLSNF